jgi:hypothetical protein
MRILFLFLAGMFLAGPSFGEEPQWYIEKSEHFLIHYKDPSQKSYITEASNYAENYYKSITDRLGFRRFNFWLWDERAKIYIYLTRDDYLKNTRQPEWSIGNAHVKKRTITTYYFQEQFFTNFLPHEMGHLIFREYVGYQTPLPLWLDEGVACIQEDDIARYIDLCRLKLAKKAILPIGRLTHTQAKTMVSVDAFYAEAATLVYFLLEEYGNAKFVDFCRRLRDGDDYLKALNYVYHLDGLPALDDAWRAWMKKD